MKASTHLILFLVFYILSNALSAQPAELDPVTITSSLHAVSASATGRNLVVIKGERFSNLPVNSVDELLRYL
ncbi:MAG TPA: TonB-dependent receptor, partial [Segetibacter sp.]